MFKPNEKLLLLKEETDNNHNYAKYHLAFSVPN